MTQGSHYQHNHTLSFHQAATQKVPLTQKGCVCHFTYSCSAETKVYTTHQKRHRNASDRMATVFGRRPNQSKPTKELLNSPEMNGICEFQFGASCLRSPPTQKRLKQQNLRGNRAPTHRGECSTGKLSYPSSSSLSCPPQRSADERESGSARRLRHKQTSL